MDIYGLIDAALEARKNSYSPYSGFSVGAALLTSDGRIYTGCNIENASYGATNCAERTAFFKAVSEGVKEFKAIAVVGDVHENIIPKDYAYPCGICRQVMREFTNENEFHVIVAKSSDEYIDVLLKDMLPYSFGPENLLG